MIRESDLKSKNIKVLASGDVEGNFGAFLKRVSTVHSKAGPFDLCLCVGSFFGTGNKYNVKWQPLRRSVLID